METTEKKLPVSITVLGGIKSGTGAKAHNAIKSLAKFMHGPDTFRAALQGVGVSEDGLTLGATDGHRLLQVPCVDVSPLLVAGAQYRIIKDGKGYLLAPNSALDEGAFPNLGRVIPDTKASVLSFEARCSNDGKVLGPLLSIMGAHGVAVDVDLVADLPEGSYKVWLGKDLSPIRFDSMDNEGWTAVIMPMRVVKPEIVYTPKKESEV